MSTPTYSRFANANHVYKKHHPIHHGADYDLRQLRVIAVVHDIKDTKIDKDTGKSRKLNKTELMHKLIRRGII